MADFVTVSPAKAPAVARWLLKKEPEYDDDPELNIGPLFPQDDRAFLSNLAKQTRCKSNKQAGRVGRIAKDAIEKLQISQKAMWAQVDRLTPKAEEPEGKPDKAQGFAQQKFQLLKHVAADKTLTNSEFRVLHNLIVDVYPDDQIKKSLTALINDTGLARQTVVNAKYTLRAKGRMSWDQSLGGNNKTDVFTGIIADAIERYLQPSILGKTAEKRNKTADGFQPSSQGKTADDFQPSSHGKTTHHSESPIREERIHSRGADAAADDDPGVAASAATSASAKAQTHKSSFEDVNAGKDSSEFSKGHASRHKSASADADSYTHDRAPGCAPGPASVAYEKYLIDRWAKQSAERCGRSKPNTADMKWATNRVRQHIETLKYGDYDEPPEYAEHYKNWLEWAEEDIADWWEDRCERCLDKEKITV
jgi:hypothetical protein